MKPLLVVGLGYVGYPLLLSLGRKHDVIGLDIDKEKVVRISCGFPILGSQTEADLLSSGNLSLRATSSLDDIPEVEAAFLCLPTDYDEEKRGLDTSGLEQTIAALLAKQPDMAIFIRSTVGIGFTRTMCLRHPKAKIAFFPEFLREKSALEDVLHPSRLILGTIDDALEDLFRRIFEPIDAPYLRVIPSEAEAIKLFSNAYLALRISYFNELDSLALDKGLNAKNIIKGVCLDPRIGDFYNNPSFGYGGYCLPKDVKQLEADFLGVKHRLSAATIASNATRAEVLAEEIVGIAKTRPNPSIGIYRLHQKKGAASPSDSSLVLLLEALKPYGVPLLLYGPDVDEDCYRGVKIARDFAAFVESSALIVANRMDEELRPYKEKVFTRDLDED